MRRYGNLWAFSTAKLESKGKRMKKVARNQTSNRKTAIGKPQTIIRKKRGGKMSKPRKEGSSSYTVGGYNGNKMAQMLGRTTYREERLWNDEAAPLHRKREQLFTLGKMCMNPKVKQDPIGGAERWGSKIPSGVEFSVVGLLSAMCKGLVKPLYSLDGKCQTPPLPETAQ